jgi:flagellin-like protein
MKKPMKNMNEKAVSPVIGVILMVAITFILAAILAAFLFGMSGNISKMKVVGATVSRFDANNISITYQGGQDANSLNFGTVTTIPKSTGNENKTTIYTNDKPGIFGPVVGETVRMTGNYGGRTEIIIVGHFNDRSDQVILDTFI